jgi:pyrimidine operon attenuation protein / uracil phosphoribosyltransferase
VLADGSKVLDKKGMEQALTRIAHEITERNKGLEGLAIVGIRRAGAFLAMRIAKKIKEIQGVDLPVGIMDITLYRDDLRNSNQRLVVKETRINFSMDDQKIILVDDVLFTGRSIRCALDQLIDFGRPKEIQLAVLIDRGHRELPIRPDYVGKNVPTARPQRVKVQMTEEGKVDEVVIGEGV